MVLLEGENSYRNFAFELSTAALCPLRSRTNMDNVRWFEGLNSHSNLRNHIYLKMRPCLVNKLFNRTNN